MNKNNKRLLINSIYAYSIILSLSACGGGKQDKGKASPFVQNFSGVAVDGHIARAKVFIDGNNNATRDPWESFAFTDNDGYYGYNPYTGTDYCASDATTQQKQYCLSVNSQYADVTVRIDGGYDKLTGEPFIGQLSRRINAQSAADRNNLVITPITTLLTNIKNQQEQDSILANLGIEQKDLNIDYLNSRGNNEVDGFLLNTALKIHKTVTILSDRIDDNYQQMRETTGMPNDASQAVYSSLANMLASNTSSLTSILTNTTHLTQVLDNAEQSIRTTYDRFNLDLPADMGSPENPQQFNRATNIAAQVSPLIDSILNDATNQGQVIGNVRALETIIIKSVNESNQTDASIQNAFNFFLDNNNATLIDALRLALSDDKANINALVGNDFIGNDFDNTFDITNAARIQDDAKPFSFLAGKKLRISDLDLGESPNNLSDIELELYFNTDGGEDDFSGSIVACAKYIDGASQTSLGEGNFEGEITYGFWSLLGANESKPSSYSLLLTFDFLGANYQAIMKPSGNTTINGVDYQKMRFDYDGEIRVWHSAEGLTEQQTLPVTSNDCANRLPSRIGL